MMRNSGARRCTRENVGGAAISTSHLVKLGSARMRTCTRRHQVFMRMRACTHRHKVFPWMRPCKRRHQFPVQHGRQSCLSALQRQHQQELWKDMPLTGGLRTMLHSQA
jgi:hypothetical protein